MQSLEKVLTRAKRFFKFKKAIWVSKTQNLTLISKPLKKFLKKYTKVIGKSVMAICTFFTFTHVRQTCLAYNFLVHLKKNFNGFSILTKIFWSY
jgi:hypothetical protein